LEEQGNQMIKQQKEFMQMMISNKAGGGGTPATEGQTERRNRTTTEGKHCAGCKKKVLHKYENCWELEANKDKRPKYWKSCLE
jgi:hypothetical protein